MKYHEILSEDAFNRTDDILFEMANLGEQNTGVSGTIYISTKQGSHDPRVKFYSGRPKNNAPSMSVTIGSEPQLLASSLPDKIVNEFLPKITEWIQLNQESLLLFWNEGSEWMAEEVETFIKSLVKVSTHSA